MFEDQNDPQSEKNGTLKLISMMKEYGAPSNIIMHAIRKEFVKKVLAGYISQIPLEWDENSKQDLDGAYVGL